MIFGLFILIGMIGGLTYAIFNYMRVGQVNRVRVGEINFSSTQETISLTNVFPASSNSLNSSNSVTITIDANNPAYQITNNQIVAK